MVAMSKSPFVISAAPIAASMEVAKPARAGRTRRAATKWRTAVTLFFGAQRRGEWRSQGKKLRQAKRRPLRL